MHYQNFKTWARAVMVMITGITTCTFVSAFQAPAPYDLETLYKQTKAACPSKDWPCYEKELFSITGKNGPKGAIETFTLLMNRHDIPPTVDAHHFVHHIGHHTAMIYGSTSEAFALCPESYNYGCLHGFFQHALGMGGSTEEAAAKICEDVEKSPSAISKTKFSCYHGLGHGVMMFEEHDLMKSLAVCDSLPSITGQQGCWQGVFMENVDVAEEGKWEKGLFSKENPLAPCDKLDPKYQHECFINHSGWLMMFYQNDFAKASQACLKAPDGSAVTCLQTLSLLTTNSSWQNALLSSPGKMTFPEKAWALCKKFPEGRVSLCVNSALDNIMNSNTVNPQTLQDSQAFCQTVDKVFRTECLTQIGRDLRYLTPDIQTAQKNCRSLKKKMRTACLAGIGPS